MLSLLANLKPEGETDIAHSLIQVAAMLRHASLVMIFSDLLADPEPVLESLYRLRHGGHDVILFHVLDEAEVNFPFDGMVELEDPESHHRLALDADGFRRDYLAEVEPFRDTYRRECFQAGVDYVAAGHQHAVRPGADRVFGESSGKGVNMNIYRDSSSIRLRIRIFASLNFLPWHQG